MRNYAVVFAFYENAIKNNCVQVTTFSETVLLDSSISIVHSLRRTSIMRSRH